MREGTGSRLADGPLSRHPREAGIPLLFRPCTEFSGIPAFAGMTIRVLAVLTLNPEAIDLATLRQLWQGAPCKLDDASARPHPRLGRLGRADRRRRRDRLRRQHRLRPARQHAHPAGAAGRASAQPDPVAQLRARRPAAAPCRAADDRPEAARPRARLFGRSAAGDRRAPGAARPRRHAGHPERRAASAPSGDLAPLAHLIAALLGEGRIDVARRNPAGRAKRSTSSAWSRSSSAPRKASR